MCSGRVDMGQRTKSFTQGLSCTRRTPGRAPNPESRVSVWGCVPPPTQGSVHVCQGEPHLGVNLAVSVYFLNVPRTLLTGIVGPEGGGGKPLKSVPMISTQEGFLVEVGFEERERGTISITP